MRILLAAIVGFFALVAGLVIAGTIAVASALLLVLAGARGLFGHRSKPRPNLRTDAHSDVIDVTATEVPTRKSEP